MRREVRRGGRFDVGRLVRSQEAGSTFSISHYLPGACITRPQSQGAVFEILQPHNHLWIYFVR
jgi:hypothetical protein